MEEWNHNFRFSKSADRFYFLLLTVNKRGLFIDLQCTLENEPRHVISNNVAF